MSDIFGLSVMGFAGLLASAGGIALAWYALPLILAISLVYGATRHEHLREIVGHSIRSAIWMVSFMLIIFAIIWVAGYGN